MSKWYWALLLGFPIVPQYMLIKYITIAYLLSFRELNIQPVCLYWQNTQKKCSSLNTTLIWEINAITIYMYIVLTSFFPGIYRLEADAFKSNISLHKDAIHVCITSDRNTLGGMIALINSIHSNTKHNVFFHLVVDAPSKDHLRYSYYRNKYELCNFSVISLPFFQNYPVVILLCHFF